MMSACSKNPGLVVLQAFLLYVSCMLSPGRSLPALKNMRWVWQGPEGSCPIGTRQWLQLEVEGRNL